MKKNKRFIGFVSVLIALIILVPAILWAIQYDFEFLCNVRAFVRLVLISPIILYSLVKISFWDMFKNVLPSIIASFLMVGFAFIVNANEAKYTVQLVYCTISSLIYFGVIMLFRKDRYLILNMSKKLFNN